MMKAARISGTSVDIQLRTRQYIPEDSELHTRRRENLKSHTDTNVSEEHNASIFGSVICILRILREQWRYNYF
jgi:hypothetical protein